MPKPSRHSSILRLEPSLIARRSCRSHQDTPAHLSCIRPGRIDPDLPRGPRRRDGTGTPADGLERVRRSGRLLYGSDMEGGGPYAYPEPDAPRGLAGFEVDLMDRLAADLKIEPVFSQGQWDKLLQVLDTGRIDAVINGYEWTEQRPRDFLATTPYSVRLPAPVDGAPRQPGPAPGRPEGAEARRRPVDGRRARGLGRRTPSPPRKAVRTSASSGSTGRRTP